MQSRSLRLVPFLSVLGLLSPCFAGISTAGVNAWTTGGPNGERILALAIDPANTATIYAGSSAGGVFKSTNRGGSWTAINNGLTGASVNALVIDPSTPAILYAGTSSGNQGSIFKTVNGGASWIAINNGLTSTGVQVLAIDPSNPATLYAGSWGNGVYKSTDSGGTWAAANAGLGSSAFIYVQALTVDPTAPAILYVGTEGPQVFKSTDSGGSWSATGAGPNDPYGYGGCPALAIDPAAPATIYAGTDYGIFKSVDAGSSWTLANTGLTNLIVMALAIVPSDPASLYAGTQGGGVFRSTDGGASWNSMNAGLTNLVVTALTIDASTPARIYAGTDGGVYEYLKVAGPLGFYTVAPCRVADTRAAPAPSGGPALGANTTRDFPVTGTCGIPSTATAVAISLAVVSPGDGGDIRLYPAGNSPPETSAINFHAGAIRANNGVIPLGVSGQMSALLDMPQGSTATTHFVVDVYGYFQ